MTSVPAIFESAIAEVLIHHAPIEGPYPRIRTWRSIDDEGRWSPDNDRVLPIITVTASTPEIDGQDQLQVAVSIGAMTDASDDQDHRQIAMLEGSLQVCIDALEAQYCQGGPHYDTFKSRIDSEMAGASFNIHVGGITHGSGQEPIISDGMLAIAMEIVIHYSRDNR